MFLVSLKEKMFLLLMQLMKGAFFITKALLLICIGADDFIDLGSLPMANALKFSPRLSHGKRTETH